MSDEKVEKRQISPMEIPLELQANLFRQEQNQKIEQERQRIQKIRRNEKRRIAAVKKEIRNWLEGLVSGKEYGILPEKEVPVDIRKQLEDCNKKRNQNWANGVIKRIDNPARAYWRIFIGLQYGCNGCSLDLEMASNYWNKYCQYYINQGMSTEVLYSSISASFAQGLKGLPKDSRSAETYAQYAFAKDTQAGTSFKYDHFSEYLKGLPREDLFRGIALFLIEGELKMADFLYDQMDVSQKETVDIGVKILEDVSHELSVDLTACPIYKSLYYLKENFHSISYMIQDEEPPAPTMGAFMYILLSVLYAYIRAFCIHKALFVFGIAAAGGAAYFSYHASQYYWLAWSGLAWTVLLIIIDMIKEKRWQKDCKTWILLNESQVQLPKFLKESLEEKFKNSCQGNEPRNLLPLYFLPLLIAVGMSVDGFISPQKIPGTYTAQYLIEQRQEVNQREREAQKQTRQNQLRKQSETAQRESTDINSNKNQLSKESSEHATNTKSSIHANSNLSISPEGKNIWLIVFGALVGIPLAYVVLRLLIHWFIPLLVIGIILWLVL